MISTACDLTQVGSDYTKEGPFCPREELIEAIKTDDAFQNENAYSVSGLENSMFLIADPFNRTYNPAKVKANSPEAEAYDRAFKNAFLHLKRKTQGQGINSWD